MPNIVLGVTSSVAIYKACDLVRGLGRQGFSVRAILTPNAQRLISSQLFLAVGAEKVFVEMFPLQVEQQDYHIPLEKWADAFLIAPCTANSLCKLAYGIADNFLSTFFLAMPANRVLIAPAMHSQMWVSSAVQEAVGRLVGWGVRFIGPEKGALASGDEGIGRLAEVDTIVKEVVSFFQAI